MSIERSAVSTLTLSTSLEEQVEQLRVACIMLTAHPNRCGSVSVAGTFASGANAEALKSWVRLLAAEYGLACSSSITDEAWIVRLTRIDTQPELADVGANRSTTNRGSVADRSPIAFARVYSSLAGTVQAWRRKLSGAETA